MRTVLVTGSAGFIGFHLSQLLLEEGFRVVGYDGMTDYYDVRIKQRRHQMLLQHPHFTCTEGMLEDFDALHALALSSDPARRRSGSTVEPTAPGAWHTAQ